MLRVEPIHPLEPPHDNLSGKGRGYGTDIKLTAAESIESVIYDHRERISTLLRLHIDNYITDPFLRSDPHILEFILYNAANEKAVGLFLQRKIDFLTIPEMIEAAMAEHKVIAEPTVDEILATEAATYEMIESRWNL